MLGILILLFSSVLVVPFFPPNSQNPCIFLASMNLIVLLSKGEHIPLFKCSLFIYCYRDKDRAH